MKKIILINVFSLLLFSCNFNSGKEETKIKEIKINLDKIQEAEPGDLFSNIEFIPLQTDTNTFIGKANKALFYNNEVYILDKMQSIIFIFNMNGKLIRKIDKKGRGPGEYPWIEDFAINCFTNNIEIIDGFNMYTYSNDCSFIEKTRIVDEEITAINEIGIIDNDILAFLRTKSPKNILYSRSQKSFIYKNDIYPRWATKKLPSFLGRLIRNNNIVNYHEAFSRDIYTVDKNGFNLKYKLDFGKYNFDYTNSSIVSELKSSQKRLKKETTSVIYKNYAYVFQNYIENEKLIFLAFWFKETTYVLYNKHSDKYLEFNKGDLRKIITFNKPSVVQFINKNEIVAIGDNRYLKRLSDKWLKWLSEKDRNTISNLTDLDNPVLIKLKLNTKQLQMID